MASAKASRGDTRRNLQLLLALRRILCRDDDIVKTLEAVAMEVAQSVADYTIVDRLEDDGTLRRLTIAHADASRCEELRDAVARCELAPGGRVALALESPTRDVELVTRIRRTRDGVHDADFEFLGSQAPTSYVQAVVRASGAPVALLTFISTKVRPFDDGALRLFEEVAGWCNLFAEKSLLRKENTRLSQPPPRTGTRVRTSS